MKQMLYALAALLCSATLAFSQGGLDPTFGNGGLVTTNFGFGETGEIALATAPATS